MNPLHISTAALFACCLLTGCGPDVAHWKEEVLLHDGRMIVVERTAKAESIGFPNANRGRDIEFELKYEPLGIYWKDTKGTQQAALEIFDSTPYLVVFIGNVNAFCKGKPSGTLPLTILKMQGKEWIPVDIDSFPVDQANYNLYGSYWGNKSSDDAKGLITWSNKEDRDAYPIVTVEPSQIIRRPFKLREHLIRNNSTCARYQTK